MQLSYSDPPIAIAGMLADTGQKDVISKVAATRQLEQVVVTTADNTQAFTITINGTAFAYTSDANATKTEIRDGLKTLIDAGDEPVTVTTLSTDGLLIESSDHDAGFTLAVSAGGSGVLTATQLVAQEQAIPFGALVVWDEKGSADQCRLPRLTGDVTAGTAWGVAMAEMSKEVRASAPYGGYSSGDVVPVVRKGRIWVLSEDIVTTVGKPAFVRFVASGAEKLGAFRTDADGSDAVALPGATFRTTSSGANGLVVLELNL